MQTTTSVSQGSFLFMPNNFNLTLRRKSKKRNINDINTENWEKSFNTIWKMVDDDVREVNNQLFQNVLAGLIEHVNVLHKEIIFDVGVLPCEILITGTNLPDHNLLISALNDNLNSVTPYISVLWSRNCGNIKITIKSLVQQIINISSTENHIHYIDDDDLSSDSEETNKPCSNVKLHISQYNMSTLCAWYVNETKEKKETHSVIIFIPDFESFPPKVLVKLINILSSYSTKVPFILIFGVATTPGAVYQSLPHNVLSRLAIQLFKSESSMSFLNQVLEKIFFSEKFPFRLGSKCMTFLTDIFLFHSFSVQGFIQGFKFCMMEHFYQKNHYILCCPIDELDNCIKKLQNDDIENIRRIPSFQNHVEKSSKEDRMLLLLDNNHTKKVVVDMMREIQEYLSNFHVALKCLHILTQDIPMYPLGRHLREYYCKAISKSIRETLEFKESLALLKFQSKKELIIKISLIIDLLKLNSLVDILSLDKNTKFDKISNELEIFKQKFDEMTVSDDSDNKEELSKEFEKVRESLLSYIEKEIINTMLDPITNFPLHEIILFDDLPSIRRRISGSPRGAIHLALNNPQYYLDCNCCLLPHPEAVLPTLPDLSIAYKIHLEFGKVINLYDWLQAFAACIKPEQSEAETQADEELQARFTRAVSELQFLGFIKPSRSKSDHVNRLTWGSL